MMNGFHILTFLLVFPVSLALQIDLQMISTFVPVLEKNARKIINN